MSTRFSDVKVVAMSTAAEILDLPVREMKIFCTLDFRTHIVQNAHWCFRDRHSARQTGAIRHPEELRLVRAAADTQDIVGVCCANALGVK